MACVIKLCRNHNQKKCVEKEISFHRFPRDPVILDNWVNIVQKSRKEEYWKSSKFSYVCSDHFHRKHIYVTKNGLRRLKKGSVPSKALFISSVEETSDRSEEDIDKLKNGDDMPMTAAERQKKYIEKLKRENPEKYESKRKQHLQKVKDRQKKVKDLPDEEKRKEKKNAAKLALIDSYSSLSGEASTSTKPTVRATYSTSDDDDDDSLADDPSEQQSDTGDDLSMYLKIPKKSSKSTADSAKQERDTDKDADRRHDGFSCNNCSNTIVGYRYTCVQCLNYDLCATCEAKGAHCLHYVLRIPKPAPNAGNGGCTEYKELVLFISIGKRSVTLRGGEGSSVGGAYLRHLAKYSERCSIDEELLSAEVQSMLTAIRSHLLYGAEPEPEVEMPAPADEVPLETIKVEIKEETPDPLESDQALVTDDNYAAYSQDAKKEFTATEATIQVSQQVPYNTVTKTGIIDNTLVIIENPVLSEPDSKRRRVNSPPPLVSVSRVAPGPAYLAPAPAYLAPTSANLAPASALLASTSAHLSSTTAYVSPGPAQLAPAPGRMLDNIILYPKREEPAAVEDKDESYSFQVFSHVKKKPSKLQAKPGQRGGKAPALTSRSVDKK